MSRGPVAMLSRQWSCGSLEPAVNSMETAALLAQLPDDPQQLSKLIQDRLWLAQQATFPGNSIPIPADTPRRRDPSCWKGLSKKSLLGTPARLHFKLLVQTKETPEPGRSADPPARRCRGAALPRRRSRTHQHRRRPRPSRTHRQRRPCSIRRPGRTHQQGRPSSIRRPSRTHQQRRRRTPSWRLSACKLSYRFSRSARKSTIFTMCLLR